MLATLRQDGSPRLSGTEVQFHDGDLWIGMMPGSLKARDLVRDPRFALHVNPGDGSMEGGDAKVAGIAHEVTDDVTRAHRAGAVGPPPDFALFRLELTEAVLVALHPDGDRLLIDSWDPGRGLVQRERA